MTVDEIRQIAQIMTANNIGVINYEDAKTKLKMEKASLVTVDKVVKEEILEVASEQKMKEPEYHEVKSPMVGVFYSAPEPGAAPFAQKGAYVKKGQVLCVIEAMKLMNDIVSDADGEIAEVCVENGAVVEYGQALFKII